MESKSTFNQSDNATIEIGTIVHEGKEFSALGSIVDKDNGIIVGYVNSKDQLTSWDGKTVLIPFLKVVSSWPIRSHLADRMIAYRAIVDGKKYIGRGLGQGMLLRLRTVNNGK